MVTFDTNAFIRFFTNDIPEIADEVEKIIYKEGSIYVSDIVFTEIEHILRKLYNLDKLEVLQVYEFILGNTKFKYNGYINKAIELFEKNSLSISDCFIIASTRGRLISFDQNLMKVYGQLDK